MNIKLRLRLFDSVVTPCALYGLSTAPVTKQEIHSLGVVQRKMIRSMVGYVKFPGEDWDDMYRRLRTKIEAAYKLYPVRDWCEVLGSRKQTLYGKVVNRSSCPLTC